MARSIFTIFSLDQSVHQIFWVDYQGEKLSRAKAQSLRQRISDSIDQKLLVDIEDDFITTFNKLNFPIELVYFSPGVTDNPAKSFCELISRDEVFKDLNPQAHSGLIKSGSGLDFNPFINSKISLNSSSELKLIETIDFDLGLKSEIKVQIYSIRNISDEALTKLSLDNCWALSLNEMKIIQAHYQELKRDPTDVEIEMLAQTWSEHCKHKIFSANIDYYEDGNKTEIKGLFKEFIKNPTYALNKPWAISLFDDNAGVVRFREGMDICIKVETHNSPSALDPYGGALTGILGVNRDIMGTGLGAKPVANTNVFCVGMPDEDELPGNLIAPKDILKGIHRGVMDGGNKSGIPTVNGAIYFDECFSGKPLVYCGTVGIIPPAIQGRDACHKGQRPGDLVVMVGGAVGRDGIHGATASSLVMDKNTTLGMVQIGDPFSQKRMLDFLLVARDKLLYNSLTDNGAGGLSSSVGEMSGATGGAILNLETVPLKYSGLGPWQILVSESQERMTLSVPKENWKELKDLADLYQVPVTAVGEFTDSGSFVCRYEGKTVCDINLKFLHDGLPKMNLTARHGKNPYKSWKSRHKEKKTSLTDHSSVMKTLLSHPTIASKETWLRQYDHEVQGATVVKPFEGMGNTAPNDAGVLWYGGWGLDGNDGFAVACGLCPHFSLDDTKLMTQLAVDESVRNLICQGADPEKIALVDNFCWPDPTPSPKNPDAEFKLAQLVRSCMGLKDMVETYRMPLVSGKDSMKNDYHGEKVKISVQPTLLVTALGHVPDVTQGLKSQAGQGQLIYRIGLQDYQKYFGHFLHAVADIPRDNLRNFDWDRIRKLYSKIFGIREKISSLHDVSEGGVLVSLFETLLMENLGLTFKTQGEELAYLYSELPGHFVASVAKENQQAFEAAFANDEFELLGQTNNTGNIEWGLNKLSVSELAKFWRNV